MCQVKTCPGILQKLYLAVPSVSEESFVRCWNGEKNTHRYKKHSQKAITYTTLEGYPTIHLLPAGDSDEYPGG